MPPRPRLIPSATAARLLGVDARTLVRWARAGRIPSYRTLGGHYRFNAEEVCAFRDNEMRLAGDDPDAAPPIEAAPTG